VARRPRTSTRGVGSAGGGRSGSAGRASNRSTTPVVPNTVRGQSPSSFISAMTSPAVTEQGNSSLGDHTAGSAAALLTRSDLDALEMEHHYDFILGGGAAAGAAALGCQLLRGFEEFRGILLDSAHPADFTIFSQNPFGPRANGITFNSFQVESATRFYVRIIVRRVQRKPCDVCGISFCTYCTNGCSNLNAIQEIGVNRRLWHFNRRQLTPITSATAILAMVVIQLSQ
jgi:hypothetical protein